VEEIPFAKAPGRGILIGMSTVQEVQEALRGMSPADRNRVKLYLLHLARADEPAHREEMTRRLQRMEQGEQVPQFRLEALHQELQQRGP